ncbi:MAG TPA: AMP-binding protein [Methylomirabilota bacterium]|jgi:acyl-CoA synthetase (AMP-forming)/AMP-acid ligase II|nr:AMP-binding protein [Methylomirabilota bacterium]
MAERDPETAQTLTEVLRRRAALSGQQPYFHLYGEAVTYGRLWELSARYAAALARAGVRAGDKVCLIYPTCAEFFYTFFGALRLGAVPVPLYPTLGVEATANIFRDSEAVAVVTIGWFRRNVDASAALAPNVRVVLEPVDLEAEPPATRLPEPSPDDLAFIQYTSGSTGQPRGVMLTHRNVVSTCHFMAEASGLTARDRVVSWLPLYHDMGLIGCSFTPPLTGTPLWLLPPDLRNPRQWLELVTEVQATFTVSPDFGYRNCVRNVRETSGIDLSTLRAALCGAEPVRASTLHAFERHFGIKNVIAPCYGLAEATLAVAIWPFGTPIRLDPSGRFVSVGRPCRGVSVRILPPSEDGTTGPPLGPGVEGEICVKSPGIMRGYYNSPEATARVLSPDGWLRTGDLGFVDGEGYLYISGRLKDLICLGGENVAPTDIEDIVDHVPGVRYSAAVGLESERTGTQRLYVVAEVRGDGPEPAPPPRLVSEIVRRVHEGRGHRPARVLLVRPGTIPKTSSGKIQRSRLAQMIQAGELRDRLVQPAGTP